MATVRISRDHIGRFAAQQKPELVMASCPACTASPREHQSSESQLGTGASFVLEAAGERLAGGLDRLVQGDQRKRFPNANERSARRPTSWSSAKRLEGVGVYERVAYARELVAAGHRSAAVPR